MNGAGKKIIRRIHRKSVDYYQQFFNRVQLKLADGVNDNQFFKLQLLQNPIILDKTNLNLDNNQKAIPQYDLLTEKGKTYYFYTQK